MDNRKKSGLVSLEELKELLDGTYPYIKREEDGFHHLYLSETTRMRVPLFQEDPDAVRAFLNSLTPPQSRDLLLAWLRHNGDPDAGDLHSLRELINEADDYVRQHCS